MRIFVLLMLCVVIGGVPLMALAGPTDDLSAAFQRGDPAAIKVALDHGADANMRIGGMPLVALAATGYPLEVVRQLLDHGADPDAKGNSDDLGVQAVHLAAGAGAVDVVSLLIDHGVTVDALDSQNDTPLDFAAMQSRPKMVAFLVARGADLKATNVYGRTALHYAAGSGAKEAASVLLALGSDKTARDAQGKTPFDLANESANLSADAKAAILPLLQLAAPVAAPGTNSGYEKHGCPRTEEDLAATVRRIKQRSPRAPAVVILQILQSELRMMGCTGS